MKKIYHLLLLLLISNALPGQNGKIAILKLPADYTTPYDTLNVNVKSNNSQTSENWYVFSDRRNNKTYANPNTLKELKTANFLDRFYVVKEQDEYVHIFKDNNPGESTTDQAEDYGWIKKENLIIWHKALFNSRNIQRKAMILNTIEAVKKALVSGEGSIAKFYIDPFLKIPNDRVANLYTIFYIYKFYPNAETPTSVLLGSKTLISSDNTGEDIWGWVSFAKLTSWDHRVAVLPNTGEEAIAERKNSGIRATVLCDENEARQFRDRKKTDPTCIFWDKDKYYKSNEFIGYYMLSLIHI